MEIQFSFKGKTSTTTLPLLPRTITANDLYNAAYNVLGVNSEETTLKLLNKGKRLQYDDGHEHDLVFVGKEYDDDDDDDAKKKSKKKKKVPKFLVMATQRTDVKDLQSKRSDPTIRGFESLKDASSSLSSSSSLLLLADGYWGTSTKLQASMQHRSYKFCKFESCSWQSFGHRPTDRTPHAFEATKLLERLATDPGVKCILYERELVIGTLGEMDPIDDRYMKQKEQHGGRLLGYNTNHGARIDLKLRTDDLSGFRHYHELVITLIHELSHNWVGDHNYLFWTNFGQMLVEYMYAHLQPFVVNLRTVQGQTTAERAFLPKPFSSKNDNNNNKNASSSSSSSSAGDGGGHERIVPYVLHVLQKDMAQHGLHPQVIAHAIQQRYDELIEHGFANNKDKDATKTNNKGDGMTIDGGYVLGNGDATTNNGTFDANANITSSLSPRERALRAAEERAKQQQRERQKQQQHQQQQQETKQPEDENK